MNKLFTLLCTGTVVAMMAGCNNPASPNKETPVTTTTVTLGSTLHPTLGSSVDLDATPIIGMKAVAALESNANVDLVVTFSKVFSVMRVFTPKYAKDSLNAAAYTPWVSPSNTPFVKVTGTAFSSINTVEQIKPLYDAGTPITMTVVTKGDVFVVKTNQDKYVAIEISDFDLAAEGTSTVNVKK